jgi:predicted ATPase/DNA-binding XRE family transcriptional regulator
VQHARSANAAPRVCGGVFWAAIQGTDMRVSDNSAPFGGLLRQQRLAAGLSQEELAERAGLSRRGISDLERGMRRPLPGTARRLADGLNLEGPARAELLSGTQWRGPASSPTGLRESHLPMALSSFVGRQVELTQLGSLLEAARLLTLTGSGGVGKTRLALEVGRAVQAAGNQRVCLVELAAAVESAAVARAAMAAVGLPERAGRPPIETLKFGLRTERLLLIVDNCEQVLQGCAELAEAVLSVCPYVRILATSRERLGIAGETVWRVPSMGVPTEHASAPELETWDATRLFLERARTLVPDFVVSDKNTPALVTLCRRLDGIALAIELAAAHLTVLSIEQISERLDDALRLLVQGSRVAPPRQRALRATIDWSYALLDPVEQLLFDRLSVFSGGWTLEAAERVCADQDTTAHVVCVREDDVVDLLSRLIAKSLVMATPDVTGAMRYRLLETLRQYGRQRLVERGQADAISNRHADYFVAWAEQTMSPSDTTYQLTAASIELDNVRSALRRTIDCADADRALRLGAATRWYWHRQGSLSEGYQWFSQILDLADGHRETQGLGHVLAAAALLAGRQARMREAEGLHTRVLALWRSLGNDHEVARSLSQIGYLYRDTGRLTEARQCFEEGNAIAREQRLLQMEGLNSLGLAETLYDEEQYDEALIYAERALDISDEHFFERTPGRSWARRAVGLIHYQRGDRTLARRFLEEAVDQSRAIEGLGWWVPDALASVAQVEIDSHGFARAGELLQEALDAAVSLGDQRIIARCLERVAYLAAVQVRYEPALTLAAAAETLRRASGFARAPVEIRLLSNWLEPATRALEPALRDQVRRRAASMTLDQTVGYALDIAGAT